MSKVNIWISNPFRALVVTATAVFLAAPLAVWLTNNQNVLPVFLGLEAGVFVLTLPFLHRRVRMYTWDALGQGQFGTPRRILIGVIAVFEWFLLIVSIIDQDPLQSLVAYVLAVCGVILISIKNKWLATGMLIALAIFIATRIQPR